MAKKIVSLYIDDTSLRLLVTSGKRIRKWDELALEPGLVKNAVVLKQAEVAAKIKQLFKLRKINSKKVILGVSGLNCLTRPIIIPQLPKEMLGEAVRREAKRLLPVVPEQLYLSWQSLPAPEGKKQVFLVAVPRKAADLLFRTLRLAGLKSELMDLKPMLLARLVKDTMAIIIDVQPTEFDIVIMADGIPQPIRTVHFPDEAMSCQQKLPMIRDELNRTIEFYNASNPEIPLEPILPVYVSGELANEAEQCQALSEKLNRPVLPLASPLESRDGLDPNRYMVNMGLVLKKLAPSNGSGLLVDSLNVLPTAYQPEPISLNRIMVIPATVIAIGLLLLLALLIQNTSADIKVTRSQLDPTRQLLQQKLAQRQELVSGIAELEGRIDEVQTLGSSFTTVVATLEKQSSEMNGNLDVIVSSLLEGLSLTSISHTSTTLTVRGQATNEEEVLLYLRILDASERFSSITLTSIVQTADQKSDFSIVLGVRD